MKQMILLCFLCVISVATYSKEVNPFDVFDAIQAEYEEEEARKDRIFRNCMIDLLPAVENRPLIPYIGEKCRLISVDPSWWDKIKYDHN